MVVRRRRTIRPGPARSSVDRQADRRAVAREHQQPPRLARRLARPRRRSRHPARAARAGPPAPPRAAPPPRPRAAPPPAPPRSGRSGRRQRTRSPALARPASAPARAGGTAAPESGRNETSATPAGRSLTKTYALRRSSSTSTSPGSSRSRSARACRARRPPHRRPPATRAEPQRAHGHTPPGAPVAMRVCAAPVARRTRPHGLAARPRDVTPTRASTGLPASAQRRQLDLGQRAVRRRGIRHAAHLHVHPELRAACASDLGRILEPAICSG